MAKYDSYTIMLGHCSLDCFRDCSRDYYCAAVPS